MNEERVVELMRNLERSVAEAKAARLRLVEKRSAAEQVNARMARWAAKDEWRDPEPDDGGRA